MEYKEAPIERQLNHVMWTPHVAYVIKHGKQVVIAGRTYMELKRKRGMYGVPSTTRVRIL